MDARLCATTLRVRCGWEKTASGGASCEMDPGDKRRDDRGGWGGAIRLHQRHPRGGGGPGHRRPWAWGVTWMANGAARSSQRSRASRLHLQRFATLSPRLAALAHFAHPGSPRGASSSGALADAGRGLSRRVARNYPGPGAMVIGSVKQLPARRRGSQAELSCSTVRRLASLVPSGSVTGTRGTRVSGHRRCARQWPATRGAAAFARLANGSASRPATDDTTTPSTQIIGLNDGFTTAHKA